MPLARCFVAERRLTLQSLQRLDAAAQVRPLNFAGRASSVGDLLAAMLARDREHRLALAGLWTTTKERRR